MSMASEDSVRLQLAHMTVVQQLSLLRATDLARAGHYCEADHLLAAMLHREHPPAAALDLAARMRAQQGRWDDARAFWRKALEDDPDNQLFLHALHSVDLWTYGSPARRLYGRIVGWLAPFAFRFSLAYLLWRQRAAAKAPADDNQAKPRAGTVAATVDLAAQTAPTATLENAEPTEKDNAADIAANLDDDGTQLNEDLPVGDAYGQPTVVAAPLIGNPPVKSADSSESTTEAGDTTDLAQSA